MPQILQLIEFARCGRAVNVKRPIAKTRFYCKSHANFQTVFLLDGTFDPKRIYITQFFFRNQEFVFFIYIDAANPWYMLAYVHRTTPWSLKRTKINSTFQLMRKQGNLIRASYKYYTAHFICLDWIVVGQFFFFWWITINPTW